MFCEKCGSKIESGSNFCEKCGARIESNDETVVEYTRHDEGTASSQSVYENREAGKYTSNANSGSQSSGLNEFIDLLKSFFKDPIMTVRASESRDCFTYGMAFLGCKDVFIALIFAVFKIVIANYATGFYWLYNISSPIAFIVILIMLIIGDGCWIALMIGIYKAINKSYDIKKLVGKIELGQIYVPIIVAVGVVFTAAFGYQGANISYLTCVMIISFFQYECVTSGLEETEKKKLIYGMGISAFVFAILWVLVFIAVENMFGYWNAY